MHIFLTIILSKNNMYANFKLIVRVFKIITVVRVVKFHLLFEMEKNETMSSFIH